MVGNAGNGKSSLINKVIGEDHFEMNAFPLASPTVANQHADKDTIQHAYKDLYANNKTYKCVFINPPPPDALPHESDYVQKIAESNLRVNFKYLSLIIYVVRLDRFAIEDWEAIESYKKFFKETESVSALVITHCECKNDTARAKIVQHFKSNEHTRRIATSMYKGIHTVGFPDLDEVDIEDKEHFKQKMQKDVSKLHQLIIESNDVVDVLKK